jgi:glycosyltransferase involved in cell wall biosynthesis
MARIALLELTATVSYGGIQTAVWNLAEALARAGHEVSVFGGEGSIRAPANGVEVRTFPFLKRERVPDLGRRFRRSVERMSYARHARAAFIDGRYDWAIVSKPFDFFWPWILPKQVKTRFAFISGGTDFMPLDRTLQKRIAVVLACSYFNAWQLRTRYRKRSPVVVYYGVDVNRFSPRPDAARVRVQLGVPSDASLFTFAGRLVGWKGLSVALQALAEPGLRDSAARLLVIGDGPEQGKLKALAAERGIRERVIFHPSVAHDRLPEYYAASDVGIFPSVGDEAFGITIAEAMSCGTPVIGSHIGGIPEVIGNEGHCGLLVPPGDVGALAQAMQTLIADSERRKAMGRAARARIGQLFTWDLVGERTRAALGL